MEPGLMTTKSWAKKIPVLSLPALVSTAALESHAFANPGFLRFPGELDHDGRVALAPSCCVRERKWSMSCLAF